MGGLEPERSWPRMPTEGGLPPRVLGRSSWPVGVSMKDHEMCSGYMGLVITPWLGVKGTESKTAAIESLRPS